MSAYAARADIRRALCRYLAGNDPERATERADALLDHWAHELAEQIRAACLGGGCGAWGHCTCEANASLIDPEQT